MFAEVATRCNKGILGRIERVHGRYSYERTQRMKNS